MRLLAPQGRRWNLLLALALLSAPAYGARPRRVEVYGHRGARARRPENTVPGFEYAVGIGVDVLELDVRVTRDSRLLVSHEPRPDVHLCLGPNGEALKSPPLFMEMTLEQVAGYDCGTLRNPKFPKQRPVPGTRIPTLGEVFEAVSRMSVPAAKTVRFYIELKSLPELPRESPPPEELARLVVEELRRRGMLSRVVLQSMDYRTLRAARSLEPTVKIAALSRNFLEDLPKTAAELKADDIAPYRRLVSERLVEAVHKAGARVVVWTVDEPEEWGALLRDKVDGIITDDPEALIGYLGTHP